MVTEDGAKKINEAIKACLSACYDAESPLTTIATFLSQLRATPGWNAADVDLVEMGVHRMLTMMVRRSASGDFEPVVKQQNQIPDAHAQQALIDGMNGTQPSTEKAKPVESPHPRRLRQPKRPVNGK